MTIITLKGLINMRRILLSVGSFFGSFKVKRQLDLGNLAAMVGVIVALVALWIQHSVYQHSKKEFETRIGNISAVTMRLEDQVKLSDERELSRLKAEEKRYRDQASSQKLSNDTTEGVLRYYRGGSSPERQGFSGLHEMGMLAPALEDEQ